MLAFRQEIARWYNNRYGVTLEPATEVLGLIGSKEGVITSSWPASTR